MVNKKGLTWEEMRPWFIGLGIAIVVVGGYIILKEKGEAILEAVKNFLRFR